MLSSDCSAKAAAAAHRLLRHGAGPGRPLASLTGSAPLLATLAWAAPALRCPLFPLDPALPEAVIIDLLTQAGVGLVVGDRAVPGFPTVPAAEILAVEAGPVPASRHQPDDLALLMATSGSSGRPKAVMLTAGNLTAAARASATCTPLSPGDRWLACLPLFHIGGFSILVRCALAGAEAVIHQGFDPARIRDTFSTGAITHLSMVPVMLARLLEAGIAPPPSLRHVLVGGAALSPDLAGRARAWGWPLQPTYGMSETASQVATLACLPENWRSGEVGRPLEGIEIGLDGAGRLRVRGPMVMAGYANPALRRGDGIESGWFTTGDLAEIGADGALTILGRADDVIVTGGKKVLPAMVEEAVARCPGVGSVGVAGRPDPLWGEVVAAVFTGDIAADDLLAWCRATLAPALRPRVAVQVAALPLLGNGKPDRSALRRLCAGNDAQPSPRRQDQPPAV